MQKSARTHDNVRYWTYGQPDKPALLMIHGFTGSHEGFQYIVPTLEKDFHVIIPDLPGFGESPLDFEPWTVDALAGRINRFVQSLKLPEPPYVISHSLGGLVAASMLAQNPELFHEKTVFISPVATKIGRLDGRRLGATFGALQYNVGKRTGRLGEKMVKSRRLSKVATKLIMTEKRPHMKRAIYQHHYKNLDYISSIDFYHRLYKDIIRRGALDYADRLKKFDPLIIAGDKDNVTPLAGEKKLATALGAKLSVVPGVGHLMHYEKPTAAAAAIAAFLAS